MRGAVSAGEINGVGAWIDSVLEADGVTGERSTGARMCIHSRVWRSISNLMADMMGKYISPTSYSKIMHQVLKSMESLRSKCIGIIS